MGDAARALTGMELVSEVVDVEERLRAAHAFKAAHLQRHARKRLFPYGAKHAVHRFTRTQVGI